MESAQGAFEEAVRELGVEMHHDVLGCRECHWEGHDIIYCRRSRHNRGHPYHCHDFRRFSPLFFQSPKRPLIQLRSTMTCFHIPYLILSHVPFLLSYLSSSFGHFG